MKKVNEELVEVEARLLRLAKRLGVKSIEKLESLFKEKGIDNPEINLTWSEYVYLRDRRKELHRIRENILKKLSQRSS